MERVAAKQLEDKRERREKHEEKYAQQYARHQPADRHGYLNGSYENGTNCARPDQAAQPEQNRQYAEQRGGAFSLVPKMLGRGQSAEDHQTEQGELPKRSGGVPIRFRVV